MKTFLKTTALSAVLLMLAGLVSCNEEKNPFLTINETSITSTAEAGTYLIFVSSNSVWTAVVEEAGSHTWLTLTNASGTNDGTITVNIAKNVSPRSRHATLKITSGSLTKYVSVSQDAAIPPPTLPREFTVQLMLNSEASNGLATENPEIKALVAKHGVTFYQSYPEFSIPQFLLYYTLTGYGYKHVIVQDFLETGLFDGNVRDYCIHFHCGVDLRLKQEYKNYLIIENPQVRALIAKHGVEFRQAFPGAINPVLGLYYLLYRGSNMPNAIQDFLKMGKFECSFFHEHTLAHTTNRY